MRRTPLLMALLVLSASPLARAAEDAGAPGYGELTARLAARRAALWAELRSARTRKAASDVLGRAREEVLAALDRDLLPAWYGTPWNFYGTTEVPQQGAIACGYFVSTVLRDAGFRVERVTLAKQASERIVKTFSPEAAIQRFRFRPLAEIVQAVRSRNGDGLYVVGMDYHVGLLRLEGTRADLCHASWYAPQRVLCEPAITADGMRSNYHVIGPVLTDATMKAWLEGAAIPTDAT